MDDANINSKVMNEYPEKTAHSLRPHKGRDATDPEEPAVVIE